MNRRKDLCPLMVSILLFSFVLSGATAMDNDEARASLRGIEAIRLAVEEMTREIGKVGPNCGQINRSP